MKPEDICIRALNQYRHYDVLAYLGLRYYLNNSATRRDIWAQKVATDVVLTRSEAPYLLSQHFKEFGDNGMINLRNIYIPGPNEALAEIALLDECAKHSAFDNPEYVFSYSLNKSDRKSVYKNYMNGLRGRHQAIENACILCPNGVVAYTDIKSFYPSITADLATSVWKNKCENTELPELYRNLGERLIYDHGRASVSTQPHILIGPMFSHFIANLVLRKIDAEFTGLPVKYFRYVDDITLVGSKDDVLASIKNVRYKLKNKFNLDLHGDDSPKNLIIPTSEWLKGKDDFQANNISDSWMTLIADLKRLLLFIPESYEKTREKFITNGFRIPFHNYKAAICERDYIDKFRYLLQKRWFCIKINSITINDLILRAIYLRNECERNFRELAHGISVLSGFERKRRIPQLRYCAGRLIYLATDETLSLLSTIAREIPELNFHAEVMKAVSTGIIDDIIPLGINAAQATAQPLKAAKKSCILTSQNLKESDLHALSIFFLNGVTVTHSIPSDKYSDILQFALNGSDIDLMRQTQNPVLRELACLHGIGQPRHADCLETAFDIDEELTMDALEQPWQSS